MSSQQKEMLAPKALNGDKQENVAQNSPKPLDNKQILCYNKDDSREEIALPARSGC